MEIPIENRKSEQLPRWAPDGPRTSSPPSTSRHLLPRIALALTAFVLLWSPNTVLDHARATVGCLDSAYATISKSPDALARKILRKHPLIGMYNVL
jgi:hypothetical protein